MGVTLSGLPQRVYSPSYVQSNDSGTHEVPVSGLHKQNLRGTGRLTDMCPRVIDGEQDTLVSGGEGPTSPEGSNSARVPNRWVLPKRQDLWVLHCQGPYSGEFSTLIRPPELVPVWRYRTYRRFKPRLHLPGEEVGQADGTPCPNDTGDREVEEGDPKRGSPPVKGESNSKPILPSL